MQHIWRIANNHTNWEPITTTPTTNPNPEPTKLHHATTLTPAQATIHIQPNARHDIPPHTVTLTRSNYVKAIKTSTPNMIDALRTYLTEDHPFTIFESQNGIQPSQHTRPSRALQAFAMHLQKFVHAHQVAT